MLSSQLEEANMFGDETKSDNVIKGEVIGLGERNKNIVRKERGKLGEFGKKIQIASVLKAENEELYTVQKYMEKISEQKLYIKRLEKNLEHTRRTCCNLRKELNVEKGKKKIEKSDLEIIKAVYNKYF